MCFVFYNSELKDQQVLGFIYFSACRRPLIILRPGIMPLWPIQ